MKRYLKYGLVVLTVFAVIGVVFYLLKRPRESIIKKIPATVSYCFTVNKEEFFKESLSTESIKQDSLFTKFKSRIPAEVFKVLNGAGVNPIGEFAVFGKDSNINVAWIGNNRQAFKDTVEKYKWQMKKHEHYEEIKINNQLYVLYEWPVILLCNRLSIESTTFFEPKSKKLNKNDLLNAKTGSCLIYGFIIPGKILSERYSWLPLKGKAFVGLNKEDKKMEIIYVQPELKLEGKLGMPEKKSQGYACFSWPVSINTINSLNLPDTITYHLNRILAKPVNQLYGQILDTISTSEKVITYDMDEEFRLTQKLYYSFKSYPGMWLQFVKSTPDNISIEPHAENLGLDKLKLQFTEWPDSYILASENKPVQKLPKYYLYADLDLLQTDPEWQYIIKTRLKKICLHAEPFEKGSMFVLTIDR